LTDGTGWAAHSKQLEALEELNPGNSSPALGHAIKNYREALGSIFDTMNVIALGVHGARIEAHAARADAQLLEDAAAELVALAAAHGLFIRQFDSWLEYVADAVGEPSSEAIQDAIGAARATGDEPELFADDLSDAIGELAVAAEQPLTADPEDRPPQIVERELLRSVGNILSGLLAPLVDFARDAGPAARRGALGGIEDFTRKATQAVLFGGSAYVLALAAGLPGEFGWIIPVLAFLKMKLKL
jgi:hypothetical protein|tara:strand:+ start:1055 stop:1786 length:732 start_codon:yes stop_codon:yes gene_type:complete